MRPQKVPDVLKKVRECLDAGRYCEMPHALQQMAARKIIPSEVRYVLKHGRHEPRKDQFSEQHGAWNYAIRGRTLDHDRELRIEVSFDADLLLVITTIALTQRT